MKRLNNFVKSINLSNKRYWIFFGIIIVFSLLIFFINLNVGNAETWDESIYAVSAYEMIKNHNYIGHTYFGIIDYSNTKPVFAFYPLVLSFKIFGFNLFAVRFMAAFFSLITVLAVGLYFKKRYDNSTSLIGMLCVLGNIYIVFSHGFRNGDCEGFYIMCYVLSILSVLEARHNKWGYVVSALFSSLCFLTRSIHSFTLPIAIILYFFLSKDFKKTNWYIYVSSVVIYIIPIFVWGYFRYQFDQWKFFEAMFNDFNRRIITDVSNRLPYIYFISLLFSSVGFTILFLFGIYKLIVGFKNKGFKATMSTIRQAFTFKRFEEHYDILLFSLWPAVIMFIYIFVKEKYDQYFYPAIVGCGLLLPLVLYRLNKRNNEKEMPRNIKNISSISYVTLFVASLATLIAVSIPNKLTGEQLLLHDYHEINPNTTEVFYMEHANNGNLSYEGPESWVRKHGAVFNTYVTYHWELASTGYEGFKIETKSAILVLNNESIIKNEVKKNYREINMHNNINYGYTLYSNKK